MNKEDILKKLMSSNTPYYKRNDITPTDGGVSRLHDNSGNKLYKDIETPPTVPENSNRERVIISGGGRSSNPANRPLTKRELNPGAAGDKITSEEHQSMAEHYYQMPVHVGNHEEHRWFDENVTGVVDNNDFVNTEALQGAQGLPSSEAERVRLEERRMAAVYAHESESEIPETEPEENVDTEPEMERPDSLSVQSLKPSEYCVIIAGQPIFKSFSSTEVKKFIDDAVNNYGVNLDNIQIVKSLIIDYGVSIR